MSALRGVLDAYAARAPGTLTGACVSAVASSRPYRILPRRRQVDLLEGVRCIAISRSPLCWPHPRAALVAGTSFSRRQTRCSSSLCSVCCPSFACQRTRAHSPHLHASCECTVHDPLPAGGAGGGCSRGELDYRPTLTLQQFLSQGFAGLASDSTSPTCALACVQRRSARGSVRPSRLIRTRRG